MCDITCMYALSMLTGNQIAERDQAEAREREFDRKAVRYSRWFLLAFAVLALYAALACLGYLPAGSWTAVGKA